MQAILSSRKEAYVSKHRERPHSIPLQKSVLSSSEVPHTVSSPVHTTVTTTKVTTQRQQTPPQPTPRSVPTKKELPPSSLPASLAKDIAEFEQAAQQMLRRMDVMLVTVKGVSNEKDPGKRLEVYSFGNTYSLLNIYKNNVYETTFIGS